MRRIINTLLLVVVLIATLVLMGPTGVGSQTTYPLEECARGCFSTEEDFMMMKGEPYDGNPYISDGDLLSFTGRVCARNADLLSRFYDGRPPADLGLDAVDILHVKDRIIAFSTELDDPRGRFTAGDLLFTPGYFIPNRALVYPFGITHDIGLDALQFRGPEDKVLAFVRSIPNLCANGWPGCLQSQLKERGIDIWFSVEGTVIRAGAPSILDGYVLSAAYGTIIAKQDALLPNVVPADIPQRGVDFGLDALFAPEIVTRVPPIYFSTEILFRGERLPFTDGDVLLRGDGVVLRNEDAIKLFYPAANFLGLDALDAGGPPPEEKVPHITHIGRQTVANINGGTVPVGGAGTGLAWYGSYWRPFGRYVAIHGEIPSGIDQFRVAYRKHDEARPANPATAKGIAVVSGAGWQVEEYNLLMSDCSGWAAYYSDGDGWYDAAEYRRLESGVGMPADCTSQLALTVWNSQGPGIDSEGHYRIWLQWKIGANIYEEAFDHHVQFDNKAPEILDLQIPGGACATYGPDDMPIMVRANFYDAHFLYYRLRLFGGNPPSSAWYPPVYHDTSAVDAVGPTGTGGATVDLHTVDMSVLSAGSVVTCAYGIMLWVEDSTIYGGFDPTTNQLPWATTYESWKEITFDYMPYGP